MGSGVIAAVALGVLAGRAGPEHLLWGPLPHPSQFGLPTPQELHRDLTKLLLNGERQGLAAAMKARRILEQRTDGDHTDAIEFMRKAEVEFRKRIELLERGQLEPSPIPMPAPRTGRP